MGPVVWDLSSLYGMVMVHTPTTCVPSGENAMHQTEPLCPTQQPIALAQGVKAIGALPQTFEEDQTKVEDFIEEVKSYFHINYDVAGFNLPMKQMAFILTLIKGPEIAG